MKKLKPLKFACVGAALLGVVSTLINEFVESKKMDETIEQKVQEALAERDDEVSTEIES